MVMKKTTRKTKIKYLSKKEEKMNINMKRMGLGVFVLAATVLAFVATAAADVGNWLEDKLVDTYDWATGTNPNIGTDKGDASLRTGQEDPNATMTTGATLLPNEREHDFNADGSEKWFGGKIYADYTDTATQVDPRTNLGKVAGGLERATGD